MCLALSGCLLIGLVKVTVLFASGALTLLVSMLPTTSTLGFLFELGNLGCMLSLLFC